MRNGIENQRYTHFFYLNHADSLTNNLLIGPMGSNSVWNG